ncbi:hypothetical protein ABZ816_21740 [Actinosynnema sp. NPDC047251]|uniref:Putative secreted protein n=1 Tax=Saccharothrix espanaensis (strain ATCC 51144 / DSM 44229 / JCM 9112 / NBRC 15066 / NRRL 15764) TaxID=1179773 RepID=K0KAX1_SACES|nr:hypothetical protein [Saccharothrix espanaensis]CCH33773.1 putative secreted protein [Saccharothrix espanaensis DSM 44229]
MLSNRVNRLGRARGLVLAAAVAVCVAGMISGTAAAAPRAEGAVTAPATTPISISNCDGRVENFRIGDNGALWHQWQVSPGGPMSGWHSLGGSLVYDIAVARNYNAACTLEVFGIGGGNAMHHIWQSAGSPGGWSNWSSLGGYLTTKPNVGYATDLSIVVCAWGPDHISHCKRQASAGSGPWSDWY